MRICYIGDGDSIHNHFMIDWFHKHGHKLLFLTDTPENPPNCEVIQIVKRKGWGPLRHWRAIRKVRRIVHKWRPHILHAHNVTGYGYWGEGAKYSPFVVTAWGSDLNTLAHKNMAVYKMVCNALKAADFITADAEVLCETAREMAGTQADVRLLQWGVLLPEFDAEVSEEMRKRFRGESDFVFISTRRLRSNYNIESIISAYSRAMATMPKSRLLIVGDDEERSHLEEQVRKLGMKDRIIFTGWLTREELICALKVSDVFISVPESDSTALSMLEAFAARLPVIVSDLPANTEWVDSGENGYLVRPNDVIKLTQAMNRMGENRDRAREWGEFNRKLVEERGDREKEMKKLEQWYKDLAQKKFQSSQ